MMRHKPVSIPAGVLLLLLRSVPRVGKYLTREQRNYTNLHERKYFIGKIGQAAFCHSSLSLKQTETFKGRDGMMDAALVIQKCILLRS